jgi:predicted secreted hydrolase
MSLKPVLTTALCVAITAAISAVGWKDAAAGYRFEFPRDHASHPDYKIEWWYYTGNVQSPDGRRMGYQVTFFRVGVDQAPLNPSRWAVRDLYMTHLAVSVLDLGDRGYRFDERVNRAGPGIAGADSTTYRVWNEDWTAGLDAAGRHVIRAATGASLGVDLVLDPGKPPAINGVNGISQKGAREGNASHYYSLTRMPTRGRLFFDGVAIDVTGESWMDHEFGTTFLEAEQRGWDWLSIQLDDKRELMLYQLRRGDGSRDPRSSGTVVEADGRTTHLAATDFTLTAGSETFRAASGATYPIRWTIRVPGQQLVLEVSTPLENQELSTPGSGVSYWEGAVDFNGTSRGAPIRGHGYLEMTGYKASLGRVLSSR